MVFETAGAAEAFLVGRVLFGAVLAFMGLNHFTNADEMSGYAEFKGIPAPGLAVPFTGGMLLFGGLALVLGAYPVLGAGALVLFLLVTTPTMHDFWAAAEEDQQDEMINFLKNVALLGGALVFLALGSANWPYALNVGLF
ncbi:DoxX family protein [Halorientalis halophila]|uniref:DoxX family protein n=1 Tax=Halorientalis halophila TaxID=3108499 RepID=UPI00300B39DB